MEEETKTASAMLDLLVKDFNVLDSESLNKSGLTKAMIEKYYDNEIPKAKNGYGHMANFLMKTKGFMPQPHPNVLLSDEHKAMIKQTGAGIISYLRALCALQFRLSACNIIEYLCALNQIGKIKLSFKASWYSVFDLHGDLITYIEAVNCFPNFSPDIAENLINIIPIGWAEPTTAAGNGLAMTIMVAHKIEKSKEQKITAVKPVAPPVGMASVAQLNGAYINPWIPMIAPLLTHCVAPIKDETELVRYVSQTVTRLSEEKVTKICNTMPQAPVSPMLSKLREKSVSGLYDNIKLVKPQKNRLASSYGTGSQRVNSVLKFVTPLNLLSFKDEGEDEDKLEVANYFGADGFAHMRAVRSFFDVEETSYDLRPNDKSTDEKLGVYKVHQGDFFHHDHTGAKILIDDVYDPDVHRKGKIDGQLHLKASSLLQFGIYDHVDTKGKVKVKATEYERVMVKARLPTDETFKYYDSCYPFIACKTTRCSSNELYIVKFLDKDLMERAYNADKEFYAEKDVNIFGEEGSIRSKAWPIYHKIIRDRAEYHAFTKSMLIVRLCHLFLINQIPILNPMKNYVLSTQRDWLIEDDEMPVNYVSRRMRNTNAEFLSDISIMVDINENEGDLSTIFQEYDKEYKDGVNDDPSNNVPEEAPLNMGDVIDELDQLMGMVANDIAGGALPQGTAKKKKDV